MVLADCPDAFALTLSSHIGHLLFQLIYHRDRLKTFAEEISFMREGRVERTAAAGAAEKLGMRLRPFCRLQQASLSARKQQMFDWLDWRAPLMKGDICDPRDGLYFILGFGLSGYATLASAGHARLTGTISYTNVAVQLYGVGRKIVYYNKNHWQGGCLLRYVSWKSSIFNKF